MPILDNQLELQTKIEQDVMTRLNDLQDRLVAAEYALFKVEVPDTRFERIYTKLTHFEASRKKDWKAVNDQRKEINTQLEDTLFEVNSQMKTLDQYKSQYESMGTKIKEIQDNITQYMTDK